MTVTLDWFELQVERIPWSGCWIWLGTIRPDGYGVVDNIRAHRLSYVLYKGHIPDKLFVCHACDVRCCVNPAHLWLGSNADNIADAISKGASYSRHEGKTHCENGHEFSIENTYIRPDGAGKHCKTCMRIAAREYQRRKRGYYERRISNV